MTPHTESLDMGQTADLFGRHHMETYLSFIVYQHRTPPKPVLSAHSSMARLAPVSRRLHRDAHLGLLSTEGIQVLQKCRPATDWRRTDW